MHTKLIDKKSITTKKVCDAQYRSDYIHGKVGVQKMFRVDLNSTSNFPKSWGVPLKQSLEEKN